MGAGGTVSWPTDVSPDDLLRRATSQEQVDSYNVALNTLFQDLLADYNSRDAEHMRTHLETIASAIERYIEGSVNLVYGGSVKKHTYVDGLSDIDVLAILNETSLANESPQAVLDYFAERIRERLPNTEVRKGNLAVTIVFSDGHEIQVLPAISTSTGVRISTADGTRWSNVVRPDSFAKRLTEVNQSNLGRVVPVIKLFKAINEQMPKDVKLSGYHIESLAIDAFKNYQGRSTYKDMLLHLCECATEAVLDPIKDSTGQSLHVDDYLGTTGSYERQKASAALKRTLARMKAGDSEASVERWREIIGD